MIIVITLCCLLTLVACGAGATPPPFGTPETARVETTIATFVKATEPVIAEVDDFESQRQEMVADGIIGWGIEDEAVIDVMAKVPRHRFVPEEYLDQAYENHPLPIGYGQTISQPYIVALMTEALDVSASDKVLEIGTGSGYQAAVMAELVDHVYTIEIIGALAERAEQTLAELGYDNVSVYHADGYFGLEEEAPFDAIIVTAAPDHVPQPLVQQLKIGGRLIIPVGPVGGYQTLWLVTRISDDEVRTEDLGGVRFVPLTRQVD